jgi:trimeric autotransporter adhesin
MSSKQTKHFCPVGFFVCLEASYQKNKKHDRERERTHPMYSMVQLKTLVSCGREPARSLPLRRGFLLIPLILVCFAFLSQMQAAPNVSPTPDGCYSGFTTAEGCKALQNLTTGAGNTAVGWYSLFEATTGSYNTGLGGGTLVLDTADSNTATGAAALLLNGTGTQNCAYGTDALVYNGFGVDGADFNNGFGAFALFNNSDGYQNNAVGNHALFENISGAGNTAVGDLALQNNDSSGNAEGNINTAVGAQALLANVDGDSNNAVGYSALENLTDGTQNNAVGTFALVNSNGAANTAVGDSAFMSSATGSFNTIIGWHAGLDNGNVDGNDNIYIGAGAGLPGGGNENSAIRIGEPGFIAGCWIQGISGVTATGGSAVFVNASGKLGTLTSSARFKDDIKPMEKASESIFALNPVTFHYKKQIDANGTPQFGLVAEEVAKVNPDLVINDQSGKPYTVRYEAVNAMVLNEFLKEHRTVQDLKATAEKQQATIALQDSQIKALTASLREQATQIQKVSAQLEMIKPAPQVVETR